jgi:hypothetical protein
VVRTERSQDLIRRRHSALHYNYQRIPITAKGAGSDTLVTLDGNVLGHASEPILWSPRAGAHHLALVDEHGATLDRVLFTVR